MHSQFYTFNVKALWCQMCVQQRADDSGRAALCTWWLGCHSWTSATAMPLAKTVTYQVRYQVQWKLGFHSPANHGTTLRQAVATGDCDSCTAMSEPSECQ